jgi:hypothetical protein
MLERKPAPSEPGTPSSVASGEGPALGQPRSDRPPNARIDLDDLKA